MVVPGISLFGGGIHGIVLSIEKYLKSIPKLQIPSKIQLLGYPITFSIVLLSWVFFRSQDLDSAFLAIKKIFQFNFSSPFIGDINLVVNSITVLSFGLLFDLYLFHKQIDLENFAAKFNILKIAIISTVIILAINLFYSTSNNFIYFQF